MPDKYHRLSEPSQVKSRHRLYQMHEERGLTLIQADKYNAQRARTEVSGNMRQTCYNNG